MKTNYILYIILALFLSSCEEEWLEIKSNKEQVVPQTLPELQALLDNTSVMNSGSPYLGEVSANDYRLEYNFWQFATLICRNAYLWKTDIFEGEEVSDWENSYERIFYANTVLDALKNLPDSQEKMNIYGQAHFFRAWNHFMLAQEFCKDYNVSTAASDLGVPLRTEGDITIPVTRPSVQQVYELIISDLQIAIDNLPEDQVVDTRPSKAAAFALLAKTYLQMDKYDKATENVIAALQLQDELMDFNTIEPDQRYPLQDNSEIVFYARMTAVFPVVDLPYLIINDELYNSYEDADLRKTIYFRVHQGGGGFNGSHAGFYFFTGIATDELYLIAAEGLARTGETAGAMAYLNQLLSHRYLATEFVPREAASQQEALSQILEERRKELVFRGIRWSDLRRLNSDPQFAVTLERELDGQQYVLPPRDNRYTMPIPDIVIRLSNIPQNER